MWLICAVITFLAWGSADVFYKAGTAENEIYSHLKTGICVGFVMGIAGIVTLLTGDLHYDFRNLLVYLPVSSMYILSMVVGYFGIRYIEVSVSSPIQNASGAVSALMMMVVLQRLPDALTGGAMVLITAGVLILGILERKDEIAYLEKNERKYKIGFVAFCMPILYCFIDSLGTFFDGWYLDDVETTPLIGVTEDTIENVANVSYQLTFLAVALILLFYVCVIRHQSFSVSKQKTSLLAALCETGGQLTYVYALSGNGIAAAPLISGYCVASAILSRIFLKEKLSKKQYLAVALVVLGIILMGITEVLEGG